MLHLHLREYPIRFGFKLVDLYDSLVSSSRGRAPVTEVPSAMESFQGMADEISALQFAELGDVFNYLRKGSYEWKLHVPKAL